MTKNEFIAALKSKLSGLPQNELDERLEFYCEMIEDKIEDGATEEEAVSSIGSVEDVSDRVLADVPFSSIVKEKIKNSRALSAWEIVLLVLGFPIWFSLLASVFAVALSIYVSIWAVVISLWAADLSFVVGVPGGLVVSVVYFANGASFNAIMLICAAVVCAGLAILFYFLCKLITKGILILTKKMIIYAKRKITRRGKENA